MPCEGRRSPATAGGPLRLYTPRPAAGKRRRRRRCRGAVDVGTDDDGLLVQPERGDERLQLAPVSVRLLGRIEAAVRALVPEDVDDRLASVAGQLANVEDVP